MTVTLNAWHLRALLILLLVSHVTFAKHWPHGCKKGATLISIQKVTLGADLAVCSLSQPERILGINYVNRNIFASRLIEMGGTIGLILITDKACCLGFKLLVFRRPLASFRKLENRWTTAPFSASPQCQQREQQDRLNFKKHHAASRQDVERGTTITIKDDQHLSTPRNHRKIWHDCLPPPKDPYTDSPPWPLNKARHNTRRRPQQAKNWSIAMNTHTHTHTLNCINSQNHVHLSNQKGNVLEKCFIEDVRKSPHMSHAQPYNILSLKFQTLFNSDHEFLKPISFWFIILPECCLFHRHSTWFKEKP